jgi:hypothetical protein
VAETNPSYVVNVDDNFHYMDEAERTVDGAYADCAAAVARCKQIVDESLAGLYRAGMSAIDLIKHYKAFGDDPWIATADEGCSFSGWTYAELRSHEIVRERSETSPP